MTELPNKITPEFLQSEIVDVEYRRLTGTMTHCTITVKNGFNFTGESACADPKNYDKELGEKFALENAKSKMWVPYGFMLKQQLANQNQPSSYLERMLVEYDQLYDRLTKLGDFLSKPKPSFVDRDQWDLMQSQLEHMTEYHNVLKMRIDMAQAQ